MLVFGTTYGHEKSNRIDVIIIGIMLELLSLSLVACSLSFSIDCSIGTLHCSSLYESKAVLDIIIFAIAVACEFASIASLCIEYFLLCCIAFILDFFGSCFPQKAPNTKEHFGFNPQVTQEPSKCSTHWGNIGQATKARKCPAKHSHGNN